MVEKNSIREILEEFGSNTTAHGIPRIISSRKFVYKFVWSLISLFAFSFFVVQSITILSDYSKDPVVTKIQLKRKHSAEFPSITFCNMNRLRRSTLNGTRLKQLVEMDGGYGEYTPWNRTEELDSPIPTKEEIKEYGHQLDGFVCICVFNGQDCFPSDFYPFQNRQYGNCYTFNHGRNGDEIRNTTMTGAASGLRLILFVDHSEYIGSLTPDVGVRVSVHSPAISPDPEDLSLAAEVGTSTSIALRGKEIRRINSRNVECTDTINESYKGWSGYKYSSNLCFKLCFQHHLFEKCTCVNDVFLSHKQCDTNNKTEDDCLNEIIYRESKGKLDCDCPILCSEKKYSKTISTSLWPSDMYLKYVYYTLDDLINTRIRTNLETMESARKNFAQVSIYFEDLFVESIYEDPFYSIASLLGSIGGLLGLWIGLSVITMFEFLGLFINICCYLFKKFLCKSNSIKTNT